MKHFHVHLFGGGWMPRPNDQDWGPHSTNADKYYDENGRHLDFYDKNGRLIEFGNEGDEE